MQVDINCPYCNHEQDIDHEDGYGYDEDIVYQQICSNCDKVFVYKTIVSYNYTVGKADCLNGEEHNYKPTITFPREYTMMRCTACDEQRKPTEEEMKIILNTKIQNKI